MAKDYDDQTIGGVNLGGLTNYLFVFTNGSEDANWQGATKGFVGDVAVDGLQADERTSGGVPYSGTIYTNDSSAGAWQDIASQNPGTSSVSTGETALIGSLEADLESAFDQIDALSASPGFTSVDASSLDGLNTQNGIAETFVINITSGFNVSSAIDITGDADDVYILRWDENANASDGYQGTVKFQSGGGINPLGDLSASNFINVAGDINASGGGSTPSGLVDEVSELDGVGGGGFFTGYWLTTGDPHNGDTQSLSNAIFTGGWYTSSDKFSLTSGTSGVYVAPTTAGDPVDPVDPTDPDCIKVLENTSPVIADLDCGEGENPDLGKDICAVTHKDMNGFGEDTNKPSSYILSLGELSDELKTLATNQDDINKVNDKVEVGALGGTDDGDGSYYVVVSKKIGTTNTAEIFFAGTVAQGSSFEAAGSFGSETFVQIYSAQGGSLLQTINFHTSCSSPLIIGDQYGSITLSGATLEGKSTGTIYTVGQTETDGDAGVVYEITQNEFDADGNPIFQVDPDTGEVTFINPPDFENPQDSDGDNTYNIEVTAFFVDENGVKTGEICEVKPLEVCVEDDCINILENTSPVIADLDCGEGENPDLGKDICMLTHKDMNGFGEDTGKPTSYVLSLGDLSSTLVTSDTTGKVMDKVEVGALTGTDDGDGSYFVLVSDQSDPSKAVTDNFFAGTVEQGDNFEAAGSFGSETFVHIYSSDGGSLLQSINFHTSCSSPLIIGDQYGSITLEGATLVGKDSNTEYTVGATETDGDAGVIYEITKNEFDDDGNPIFQVDPDTGEVTFVSPPDFENPLGDTPDNKYDIEVTAFFVDENGVKTGEICEVKPLEICVEDQDCIEINENTTGTVIDLDLTVDCPVEVPGGDMGLDACEVRDQNGYDKPAALTFTLGNGLSNVINSSQDSGKVEITSTGATDNDGTYFIRVSRDGDPNKTDKLYFSGDVGFGESFTALTSAIDEDFGGSTYLHIFNQAGGQRLQTIEFHTSCSQPIVIGDQYGSVSLTGFGFEEGGQLIEFGGSTTEIETLGEGDIVYSIVGGDDAAAFTVDPDTGEVSFIDPPDFESSSVDGDDNYEVIVRATSKDDPDCFTDTPVEICVKDVPELGSLSGRYFCDTNNNDIDDNNGDEPGIAGVLVLLRDPADNSEIARTFTADDGTYSFEDLTPGTYRVVFRDPDGVLDGKQLVEPNVGDDDAVDSDARGDTDRSVINGIEVVAGEETGDNDAGAEKTASLGDKVFLDADRDGIQDPGEAGVAGVTVTLTGGGEDGVIGTGDDDTTDVQVTNGAGEYLFEGLDPGTEYKVTFSDLPEGTEFTEANVGNGAPGSPADAIDSDADPANGMTGIITLDPGEENRTVDAGIVGQLGSLSGRYFCDTNDNDVDDGEDTDPGEPGVVVTLFDAAGNEVASTTTGDEGVYRFDGLEAGTYSVQFTDPDGVLEGKQLVDPNVGDDDTVDSDAEGNTTLSTIADIVVEPGEETGDNDAGAEKTASLGDKVFLDADRDGIQDPGEAGVAGVTVTLTGGGEDGVIGTGDDDTTDVQVTNGAGEYLFEGLDPGTEYKVTFSDLPEGTEFTEANVGNGAPGSPADAIDSDADPANGMTGIITLDPGEENRTVDAGIVGQLGSLSGRYFCDTNDNDVDDGEDTDPGEPGVVVTLFDAAGNEVASTTTGDEGVYRFDGLEAGTYSVQFTDPDGVLEGKQLVDPNVGDDDTVDSDAEGNTTLSTIADIVVEPGEETGDNDAGAEKTASLGDKVFLDADRDGIQDPGEAGVAGVTVTLTGGGEDGVIGTGDDDTTDVQVTNGAGEYLFEGLDPGTEYKVTFSDLPEGTEFTEANVGNGAPGSPADAIDSDADPANGMTGIITLDPGEENRTVDAGIVGQLGSLSGRYFCDTNDNDVDDGEDTDPGEPGVVVTLFDAAGNEVASTTTGDEGVYRFDGLEAGTYSVQFTDPDGVLEGKQLVDPNVGDDDTVDSDAEGNTTLSTIADIVVEPGEETGDNDAGAEKTASLGDKVFLDADRDGIQDPGEAGVAGVTVTLTGGGEDGVIGTGDDDTTDVQVTNGAGEYLFEGLDPGTEYKVTFSDLPEGTEFTEANVGNGAPGSPADAIDSDADPANGMTGIITLDPGEENRTVDAGIVGQLGSLSGRYFCDTNDNDVDDGEDTDPGEPGVVVTLFDAAGNEVASTTTGDEGVYRFDGLEAGTYSVQFTDPDGVLEGKQLVDPNVGDDDTVDSDAEGNTTLSTIADIVVEPGEETGDNDAGAEKTASLGDKVFLDADRDGIQDPGEAGVAGVTVTLTGGGEDGVIGTGDDDTTDVQVTNGAGEYLFEGLDPGTEYKVTFSDLPEGTEFTEANVGNGAPGSPADAIDSDADPANGMTGIITLDPGEENRTVDAGIVGQLGSLSGRYFCDTNDNDVDDGEDTDPGEPGVVVTLFDAAGNEVASTTTGDEGVYRFDGLEAGTYSVQFTDPDGVLEGKQLVDPNVGDDDTVDSDAEGNTTLSTIADIVVEPGEETGDNDAGAEKTASLGDKVFLDADRDGIQDPGEAGVAGVTVTLTGGGEDGVIGTGDDDTTDVQVTNGAGEYLFEGLDPGTEYKVTFSDLPEGTEFTEANVGNGAPGSPADAIDSDADPANGMTGIITLDPGEENRTVDAGIVGQLGSLSGRYFCDTNDNDVDDGEDTDPGEPGVVVTLFDAAGNEVASTTTGDEGVYRFDGLEAGTYSVQFTDPDGVLEGKQLVDPNVGDDDTVDSDAEGNTTLSTIADIVVEPGEETGDNDAGAEKTASLGDKVFLDADRDGIQDPGEAGVAGVTVTLTGGGEDGVIGTGDDDTTDVQVTNGAGEYLFEGLDPGTEYKVTFSDLPEGTEFTEANVGNGAPGSPADAIDSDADPANGMTGIITLDPGEENRTVDAGIVGQLGSLSGRYFCDTNDNDVDDGEDTDPGEPGVVVTLFDAAGNEVASTTTGDEGVYRFDGLEAGTYSVQFTDPDGVLEGKQLVDPNVGDDDTVDSDAEGNTTLSTIADIVVEPGEETGDNDAGAEKTASLGDKVFLDADRDGIQDPGEAGVAGVTVTLTGGGEDGVIGTGDDDTTDVQVTNGAGEYLFEGLDPGTEYKVTFSDLPEGTEFTEANVGNGAPGSPADAIDSDADPANGMTGIITLDPGEENRTVDAGIVGQLGSLSGRYFCDTNDNDVDDGEDTDPGEPGVVVTLFDAAGNEVASTTTGDEGVYRFDGLEAGTYSVQFTDPDGVLEGKQLVDPNVGDDDTVDSDAEGNTTLSTIADIVVEPGEETGDNDAGAEKTASLGDKVFLDADRDGIQDPGEAGVAGVTVTLTGGGEDGVIGTGDDDTTDVQVTNGAGEYLFEGLDPGTEYKVTFSDLPEGTEFTEANVGNGAPGSPADAIDSDADPANGMTGIITLDPGEENRTVDAGIVGQLGSISGRYFVDAGDPPDPTRDCDGLDNDGGGGTPESSEPVVGATVELLDEDGNVVATTTTDDNGGYLFTGLEAGDYSVRFAPTDGAKFTDQDVGGNASDDIDSDVDPATGATGTISLEAGQNVTDVDAGICPLASLGDRVWLDEDRDGCQDDDETTGIQSVSVTLLDLGADGLVGGGDDVELASTTTDANGFYEFTNLDPELTYAVAFGVPAGYTASPTNDPDCDEANDSDGNPPTDPGGPRVTDPITLAPGENNPDVDQGYFLTPPLDPEPDAAKVCAYLENDPEMQGMVVIDVLANDVGEGLTITSVDGQAILLNESVDLTEGGTVTLIEEDGVQKLKFSADGDFDSLEYGSHDTFTFSYEVRDSIGATATESVDMKVCGALNTTETIFEDVQALGTVTFQVSYPSFDAFVENGYQITINGTGNGALDGQTFTAFCLNAAVLTTRNVDIFAEALTSTDQTGAPNSGLDGVDFFTSNIVDVLGSINWILNQDYSDNSPFATQLAIWEFTNGDAEADGFQFLEDLQIAASGTATRIENYLAANQDVVDLVDEIIVDGLANQNFVVSVETGNSTGLILDPLNTEQQPSSFQQPFITSFDGFDCVC